MLTPPTTADLAAFSGRDAGLYDAYADQALTQATLLFETITGVEQYPSDPAQATLVRNAIAEMADRIYLEQSYREDLAAPFQSETIGSFSYSKSTAANLARNGLSTGLLWWDLAVDRLTTNLSLVGSGSVGGGFEDALGTNSDGRRGIREPQDEITPPYRRIS